MTTDEYKAMLERRERGDIRESDTPRTDAVAEHIQNVWNDQACGREVEVMQVPASFARQLERELTEAQMHLKGQQ